jgi:hypothetical protein
MYNSNLVMDRVAILEGYNVSLKLSDISRLLLELISPAFNSAQVLDCES